MIGLLVGTLGAAGYKTALEQLRQLAAKVSQLGGISLGGASSAHAVHAAALSSYSTEAVRPRAHPASCCCCQAGRKTYTLLMGKPNPAKLANFPEIEVFVMLADPQGLILDSKEYLSPIISPHEAFLALTGRPFEPAAYRLDFGDLLQLAGPPQGEGPGEQQQQQRRSAAAAAELGGDISSIIDGEQFPSDGNDEQLAAAVGTLVIAGGGSKILQHSGAGGKQVQVRSAAQYLVQERTYRGLETPAVGAEALPASLVVEGRSGRAAGYVDEPTVG
jgi:diphthamide biosynthesis protein 2